MITFSRMFIIGILITLSIAKKQIWIKYEALKEETDVFQKYFHRIKYGYFVDLGGFNPIQYSNTVKLSNWNGIIVEANQKRSTNIRDFQPHITSLNYAMSNVSGEIVTFYEADYNQASSLSVEAIVGRNYTQQKAFAISMADLCHKYYKAKPNLLNIDVEGIGEMVLRANDWSTDRCVPDIIYAEDAEPNRKAGQLKLEEVVLSHNYTKMDRVKTSSLFIHNSRLQFYKKEAEANAELLSNKILYYWDELTQSFTQMLGKKFEREFDSRTNPAFPYFRQLNVIDIVEINKYSNFISTVGLNRPLIIMEYDEKLSQICLGTKRYMTTSIKVGNFHFMKITADYQGDILTVYVFDHQKYDEFNVRFVQQQQNRAFFNNREEGVTTDFKFYMIIILLMVVAFNCGILWMIRKKIFIENKKKLALQQPQIKPLPQSQQ